MVPSSISSHSPSLGDNRDDPTAFCTRNRVMRVKTSVDGLHSKNPVLLSCHVKNEPETSCRINSNGNVSLTGGNSGISLRSGGLSVVFRSALSRCRPIVAIFWNDPVRLLPNRALSVIRSTRPSKISLCVPSSGSARSTSRTHDPTRMGRTRGMPSSSSFVSNRVRSIISVCVVYGFTPPFSNMYSIPAAH